MGWRVSDRDSRGKYRADFAAAAEEAADHPPLESKEPRERPETAGAGEAVVCMAARQEGTRHPGQSLFTVTNDDNNENYIKCHFESLITIVISYYYQTTIVLFFSSPCSFLYY